MRFVSALLCGAMLGNAGVYLEPNRGQAKVDAAFVARTPGGTLTTGPAAIEYRGRGGSSAAIVLEGATPVARAYPQHLLPGVSHYIRGSDPARWLWDVPHYSSVRYENIYPGIDLVYHASQENTTHGNVEFDFCLRPGANPQRIRMRMFAEAELQIEESGALSVGGATLHAPIAWQNIQGKRIDVPVRFALNKQHRVSFQLGGYDRTAPLTIDPTLQFATFLGGSGDDIGMRVASGSDGAIYLAGNTTSADFPATLPAGDSLNRPETLLNQTSFISRLRSDASQLDWSLFIGGTARQSVFAMKLDTFGNLYLLGGTTSANFPVTPGAWRTSIDPSSTDLFLVKVNAKTGHIVTSTFLGIALYVNTLDKGASLAIDAAGGVYIGGYRLFGGNFQSTPGALDTTTPQTAFVIRFNSAISAAVYESYWPYGSISAIAVDTKGDLVIGGTAFGCSQCGTPTFPAVHPLPGVNQNPAFPAQAYIARLNPTGTAVDFASLLSSDLQASGVSDLKIASDSSIYAVGWTSDADLSFDQAFSGGSPFLFRIAGDGKSLLQSTILDNPPYAAPQGTEFSANLRLVFLPNGRLCLTGLNLPISQQTAGGLLGGTSTGGFGGSLSCFDSTDANINLSTDLPLSGNSIYKDVTTTSDGEFLFTGNTDSTLLTTPGVIQPKFGGSGRYNAYAPSDAIPQGDAFLMRVSLKNPAPDIQLISPGVVVLDNGNSSTCSSLLTGSGFGYGASITVDGQAVTGTLIDSGQYSLSFPCSALKPGANKIVMTLPAPGGGSSEQVVTGINAPPSSVSVSPASVTQGAAETKLVIRATNLSAHSVLYWNGSPRTASFVLDGAGQSTGHFELVLEPPDLAQPSTAQIAVSNPAPGGGISASVAFNVQPASGAGIPALIAPDPFIYGSTTGGTPRIQIAGSGFTASTKVFWDGAQVPVSSFTSTLIDIQPPARDLTHLGAHEVYAVNGAFQSLPVRVYLARAIAPVFSAYDPIQKRLYVLGSTEPSPTSTSLFVFDATSGNLLKSLTGIVPAAQAAAISADGRYVYLAGGAPGSLAEILRYNTSTAAVDLKWKIPAPAGQTMSGVNSLATPPNSPETVIVSTSAGDVMIFDGDRQRQYDSMSAGFSANFLTNSGFAILFASATRIYATPSGSSLTGDSACWIWFDYDGFGIAGGQPTCSGEPPETKQDSGVAYLTDGARTFVISIPRQTLPFNHLAPSLVLDLTTRNAWSYGANPDAVTELLDYRMDALQLEPQGFVHSPYYGNAAAIYSIGDGAVLLVLPTELVLIPAVATNAQPSSRARLATNNYPNTNTIVV